MTLDSHTSGGSHAIFTIGHAAGGAVRDRMMFTASVGGAAPGQTAHTLAAPSVATAFPQDDSTLIAEERVMCKALQERDALAFQRAMRSVIDVDVSGIRRTTPASLTQYVTQFTLGSHSQIDFHVTHDALVAVLTCKAVVNQTCWGQKAPSSPRLISAIIKFVDRPYRVRIYG